MEVKPPEATHDHDSPRGGEPDEANGCDKVCRQGYCHRTESTASMSATLAHRFKHHPPKSDTVVRSHEEVRAKALEFAELIEAILPPGSERERAMAIGKVEEAMMWANAGIARHS